MSGPSFAVPVPAVTNQFTVSCVRGANGGERFFLTFMLSGVLLQEMANRTWRATFGRFSKSLFRFKIGGQW